MCIWGCCSAQKLHSLGLVEKDFQHNIPKCNQALGHVHAARGGSDLYFVEQEGILHSGMGFGCLQAPLHCGAWHCCHSARAPGQVLCLQHPPCSVTRDQLSALLQFVLLASGQQECSFNWGVVQRLIFLGCLEFLTLKLSCNILPLQAVWKREL